MIEPSWLTRARLELGTKEGAGALDNPKIIKYWHDAGIAFADTGHDEVPWCAAFVGAMLALENLSPSRAPNARSYETWGSPLLSPCLGAIVVISRPPIAWQGHVAFYLGTDKAARRVRVLGGNQGDAVTIAEFSLDRVVAYRWPAGSIVQPQWIGPIGVQGAASINPNAA